MSKISLKKALKIISTEGFSPYKRISRGREYITIRHGYNEYMLGQFDQKIWNELVSVIPEKTLQKKRNHKPVDFSIFRNAKKIIIKAQKLEIILEF